MKITLEIDKKFKTLDFKQFNLLLGKNGSGKTILLNQIKKGFEGKDNNFLYNGITPPINLFNIIYIGEERDLEAEVELKAKSYIKTKIIKEFINNNMEEISELSDEYLQAMSKLFEKNKEFNYILSKGNICFTDTNLNKLESLILELLFEDKLSKSAKEEFYFRIRLENLDKERYNLILIDNLNRYLDNNIIKDIFDKLPDNVYVIATSKDKYLLDDIEFNKVYGSEYQEITLIKEAKINLFKEYLQKENINKTLDDYILENEEFFNEKDYKKYFLENKIKILKELKL